MLQLKGRDCQNELKKKSKGVPWWPSGQDSKVFTAEGSGSVPGRGTEIPQAVWCGQKKKKKKKKKQDPNTAVYKRCILNIKKH